MFNILIISICFLNFLYSEDDKKKIPELDLRNFNSLIENLSNAKNADSFVPNKGEKNNIILFDNEIEAINLKSKEFIPIPITQTDMIILSTNFGTMQFKFYNDDSPINSLNFKKLSNSKFYDKTLFHYVVPKFIIQGGDILSRNENPNDDGQGDPGWFIESDDNVLEHKRGTLSMVRTVNDRNSAGSQFFISLQENKNLDGKYTVFAYLVDGDYILSRITNIPSEYEQAKLLCKIDIPEVENREDWVELYDPVTKNNIYSKVPDSQNKKSYKEVLQGRLNNTFRPGIPIIVDSIRVLNEKNINK